MPDTVPNTLSPALAFGHFVLDRKRRQLLANGVPVRLQSRAFDILDCLVDQRHRAVTRDEIVAHVWRGQTVAETNLTVQMSNLRRALDEHGGANLIITVNRAYQFVGDIIDVVPPPPPRLPEQPATAAQAPEPAHMQAPPPPPAAAAVLPAPPQRRPAWRAPVLLGLCGLMLALAGVAAWRTLTAAAPPRLSMAVLPFLNLGASHDQDYLAEAVSDDLTADLSHIPGSVVIARESTAAYQDRNADAVQIGRALNVRYLIAGTVRIDGAIAHINAHLTDASQGNELWSDRFDKPVANLSEARDAIVYRIASALHLTLDALEASRSEHDRPNNPDAQDLLFRARALMDSGDSLDNFHKAQALLEQATRQQSDFGDAHAELAWLMMRKVLMYDEETDWADATRAIDRALQVVPNNTKVLAAQARERITEGRYKEAEATATAVLQQEPSSLEAHWVIVNCAWFFGQLDREDRVLQEIARLDPADAKDAKHIAELRGFVAALQGRPRDAIGLLYSAINGDPEPAESFSDDRAAVSRLVLIAAYDLAGEHDRARELFGDFSVVWKYRSVWRVAAELPKAVAQQKGTADLLAALERSGMPHYSVPPREEAAPRGTCGEGEFRPTPPTLPDGSVADTKAVQRLLLTQPAPLVIDLGEGAGVVPGAIWFDPGNADQSSAAFIDRIVAGQPDRRNFIVMSDGWTGCDSYKAALYIRQKYQRDAVWYRGGEEAWAAAGLSATDRRH